MNHEVECEYCGVDLRREHPAKVNMVHFKGLCSPENTCVLCGHPIPKVDDLCEDCFSTCLFEMADTD